MTPKCRTQLVPQHKLSKYMFSSESNSELLFTASEKQMMVVCRESPKEYLQPFKNKLEEFFQKGRRIFYGGYHIGKCSIAFNVSFIIRNTVNSQHY